MTSPRRSASTVAGKAPESASPAAPVRQPVVARAGLYERLSAGVERGVVLIAAPPGSGKTVLLRSWIDAVGLTGHVAWVSVERGERDAQRFWLTVIEQLRSASGAVDVIGKQTPTPTFNGDKLVDRLITELGSLREPLILVIDDLHELVSPEARTQLEYLIAHQPALLGIVLATRHDPRLGLHRLRLAGRLTEVRAADLRFTLQETRELLAESGVLLSEESLALLQARTEGWAAGVRLAALSLAGHPDPERFVVEFSGSERTVADYLLSEVLERQPEEVRRLLLHTSILDRLNGPLADAVLGGSGSERILHALEQENAFIVSLDADRTWFRYHHLFADMLRLELRRTEPDSIPALHRAAASWYAEHGYVLDAIRHAEAAGDWAYAALLLEDHFVGLILSGYDATINELLAAFPERSHTDPQLALAFAGNQLVRGSTGDAAAYLAISRREAASVPAERRRWFDPLLTVERISLACRMGDFDVVFSETPPLIDPAVAAAFGEVVLGNDVRGLALLNLGIAETWTWRIDDAMLHLGQGLQLARRIDRPYIEIGCLSHLAFATGSRSFAGQLERCHEAISIAEAHGWESEPIVGVALATLGMADVWQGRFDDARAWLDRAEQALPPDLEPATEILVYLSRGMLYAGTGRLELALAALRSAKERQSRLISRHALSIHVEQLLIHTLLRLDRRAAAHATLAALDDSERDWGEAHVAAAMLRLAEGNARAAIDLLTPVLDGATPLLSEFAVIQALLLTATARETLGEPVEAEIERALDLAEPDAVVFPFLITPVGELLERHRRQTRHAALLTNILDVIAGSPLRPRSSELGEMSEELSESELRVLRYLPSNLSASEIAAELFVSTSTVKTHMRHIYDKLDAHRRTEAVERARTLGLLGPAAPHRH